MNTSGDLPLKAVLLPWTFLTVDKYATFMPTSRARPFPGKCTIVPCTVDSIGPCNSAVAELAAQSFHGGAVTNLQ